MNDISLTLPSAPDSFPILSALAPDPHLTASFLASMQPKDPWTANPKIVRATTVLNDKGS